MTIVVTGATGHLGRLVVESLLSRGVAPDQIVAGGRAVEKLDDLAARGVRVARIDYTDAASLAAAFAGADTLVLVSGSEVGQRVPQHRAAIDAAREAGIGHVIYTSAPAATTSALAVNPEHKATEEMLEQSGLRTTILRNNWYTENYAQVVAGAGVSGEITSAAGEGRVASAPRSDYAEAAAIVALDPEAHAGAVYELAGDHAWDFAELAEAASEVLGRPVVYRPLSPQDQAAALVSAGMPEPAAQFMVAVDQNIRDGLLAGTSGDLARLLGRPTVPLVEALRAR